MSQKKSEKNENLQKIKRGLAESEVDRMNAMVREQRAIRKARDKMFDQKKHAWVTRSKNYDKIIKFLEWGYPLTEAARYIQEDLGEQTEVKRTTLIKRIERLQHDLPPEVWGSRNILEHFCARYGMSADNLDAMDQMLRFLIDRIEINYKKEREIGMTFQHTCKEIGLFLKYSEVIIKLKYDLGIIRPDGSIRTPRKHGLSVIFDAAKDRPKEERDILVSILRDAKKLMQERDKEISEHM